MDPAVTTARLLLQAQSVMDAGFYGLSALCYGSTEDDLKCVSWHFNHTLTAMNALQIVFLDMLCVFNLSKGDSTINGSFGFERGDFPVLLDFNFGFP